MVWSKPLIDRTSHLILFSMYEFEKDGASSIHGIIGPNHIFQFNDIIRIGLSFFVGKIMVNISRNLYITPHIVRN